MAVIPRKPYLINALCEWAEDNGWTPMLVVMADRPDVQVPREQVVEGKITLNISSSATRERDVSAEGLHALARFSGEIRRLTVPLAAIEAFVVRETGEGMLFPPESEEPDVDLLDSETAVEEDNPPPEPGGAPPGARRGHLKVVK